MLLCAALALAFRPDGRQLAVALISGRIVFWDVQLSVQVAAIDGQHDLGYTRKDQDKITAKKSSSSKCFTSLCYTADGSCVLAGGRSKNICIYSVADQILVKKFEVSCNLSFDGMQVSGTVV
jgi:periodic tryptophan protein 2